MTERTDQLDLASVRPEPLLGVPPEGNPLPGLTLPIGLDELEPELEAAHLGDPVQRREIRHRAGALIAGDRRLGGADAPRQLGLRHACAPSRFTNERPHRPSRRCARHAGIIPYKVLSPRPTLALL